MEIGSASHDDPTQPADKPGIRDAILFMVPYQLICASIFAVGTTVSPALAEILLGAIWPLVPLVGPMATGFDWGVHAPRPQSQVKWWMCYPYYHVWRTLM